VDSQASSAAILDRATKYALFDDVSSPVQAEAGEGFAGALQGMAAQQLKSDALKDVRTLALAALGVGAAGRGAAGLYNLLRKKPVKRKLAPAVLPLPFPVGPEKKANFLSGGSATGKAGIPWYGPAMLFGGLGGMAAGWKGMDAVLDARRKAEAEDEVERAKADFHEALLSQYAGPAKKASDSVMGRVGEGLDRAFEKFSALRKSAVDWGNLGGMAAGGYGMYAGLTGLLAGAMVYDKMGKRSRRSVLEKALQRRQRRQFAQSPTEIYAVPEPVKSLPSVDPREGAELLVEPPEEKYGA
jgi:hypothetical protein